jgi:3'(2'), 5'-bisphosphate nucleotidase
LSDLSVDLTLALSLERVATSAGALIMRHYAGELEVMTKSDASPVTLADQEANDYIVAQLQALTPEVPVIAEESVEAGDLPEVGERFWLVDPLDGTKEFINKNGDFTVNIALIERGAPTLGVIFAPALGESYIGLSSEGAWRRAQGGPLEAVQVRATPDEGAVVLTSRSHRSPETSEFLEGLKAPKELSRGSSLKLCVIAAGEADFYPRYGRTMLWDIVAGHAVILGAGGSVTCLERGQPLRYEPQLSLANPFFLARGTSAQ